MEIYQFNFHFSISLYEEIVIPRAVARLSAVGGGGKDGAIQYNFLNFKNNLRKIRKFLINSQ